jgi:transposase-like protein/predicted RNA-binding Zn-ribbon protein involved in translation (DUF1610 family)
MNEYPRTIEEFKQMFRSEADCIDYLFCIRLQHGFVCPKCGNDTFWIVKGYLYQCRTCRHQSSVKAGTIFQDSKIPLTTWFNAIWLFVTQKSGASAKSIQQNLGLPSYQTAWTLLQKLRKAMVMSDRTKLSGIVEVDESYLGGSNEGGKRGRGSENKIPVLIAVELKEIPIKSDVVRKDYYRKYRLSRVRLQCVEDVTQDSIIPFIRNNVEQGSTVITDGLRSYSTLEKEGYHHIKYTVTKADTPDEELPHVHLAISLLDRWMLGTLQGGTGSKHLQAYMDEFVFRFNRKRSTHRGLLFYRMLEGAVCTEATTFRDLVDHSKINI